MKRQRDNLGSKGNTSFGKYPTPRQGFRLKKIDSGNMKAGKGKGMLERNGIEKCSGVDLFTNIPLLNQIRGK